jgi:hypothetical protein
MAKNDWTKSISFLIPPRENRAIFLLCIGIALVLWALLKLSKTYTFEKNFSIEYQIPASLAFRNQPPAQLTATLEGRGWQLARSELFRGQARLTVAIPDETTTISRDKLLSAIANWLGSGQIRVLNLSQDYLSVKLGSLSGKKVPVRWAGTLNFALGFGLSSPLRFSPDSVTLWGAKSVVDTILAWPTQAIHVNNLSADFRQKIALAAPYPLGVRMEPAEVEIHATVEAFVEKTMYLPIRMIDNADSVILFPRQVQVRLSVGARYLAQLSEQDFDAVVDFSEIEKSSGQNYLPIEIRRQPDYARVLHFRPQAVEFFFVEK